MRYATLLGLVWAVGAVCPVAVMAAQAPAWMHAQVDVPLPEHTDETSAVLLYSEVVLRVAGAGKIHRIERKVYKILRGDGDGVGTIRFNFDAQSRITALHGWSIPAAGKDYEVKDKDTVESALADVENGELASDLRIKTLHLPAATPGSILGYEMEQEQRPYSMTDEWEFQDTVPVREARYSVQLPPGWSYKAFWLNHPEEPPTNSAAGQWLWTVHGVKPIKIELNMPPWRGIAGKMMLALLPPQGQQGGWQSWQEIGAWYGGLTRGRRNASPQIKQKVQELTATVPDVWGRMQALASFVQHDIRYIAIELGIGGVQPHAAAEVFAHRYGDCKDKVTLLSSMLAQIGIDSHYVIVNTRRGSFTSTTPPNLGFNHAILAIELPASVEAANFPAVVKHGKLGRILFFDPTHPLIPFGQLPGVLQANFGLLVTPDSGELLQLPQSPMDAHGVRRTAKLTLDEAGTLRGDVTESWIGDKAAEQRQALYSTTRDVDQIKTVESLLSHSFGTFQILKAAVVNLHANERPLVWRYTLEVERYAKTAGDLLLVRPRVLGSLSSGLLETKEPRQNPLEFDYPEHDTDSFEIEIPAGFVLDELPPAVDVDLGFASYHSVTQLAGRVLRYTRSFELKGVSIPLVKSDELKQFYRTIEGDERMSVVLKRAAL